MAHHMSLINVQAGVALHLLDRHPEQVEPALTAIKSASGEALTEMRSLVGVLRREGEPAPRSPVATLDALGELVERSGQAGLAVSLHRAGEPRPLPAAVDLAAFRVVQEAVTNVVRHAAARHADVVLDYGTDELTVRIEDDGHGAGPAGRERETASWGCGSGRPLSAVPSSSATRPGADSSWRRGSRSGGDHDSRRPGR